MALGVGLLFGSRIDLQPEWTVFLCGRSFLAVFMADLVVEAMGKPYNRLFWLHGSLRPWFWKALAPKASLRPPLQGRRSRYGHYGFDRSTFSLA